MSDPAQMRTMLKAVFSEKSTQAIGIDDDTAMKLRNASSAMRVTARAFWRGGDTDEVDGLLDRDFAEAFDHFACFFEDTLDAAPRGKFHEHAGYERGPLPEGVITI